MLFSLKWTLVFIVDVVDILFIHHHLFFVAAEVLFLVCVDL